MATAYSRSNPKYRRLYACKDLCHRQGFSKSRIEKVDGEVVHLYVRRILKGGKWVVRREARVFPDGSVSFTDVGFKP